MIIEILKLKLFNKVEQEHFLQQEHGQFPDFLKQEQVAQFRQEQQEQREQDLSDQKLADEAAGRAFARRQR